MLSSLKATGLINCLFPLNTESTCKEILEGESYTIKLNSPKEDDDQLTWKCNDTPVYRRRNKKINQTFTVDDDGSLNLKDISKSNACTYKAEHYDKNGKSLKVLTETLCVLCKYNTLKKI